MLRGITGWPPRGASPPLDGLKFGTVCAFVFGVSSDRTRRRAHNSPPRRSSARSDRRGGGCLPSRPRPSGMVLDRARLGVGTADRWRRPASRRRARASSRCARWRTTRSTAVPEAHGRRAARASSSSWCLRLDRSAPRTAGRPGRPRVRVQAVLQPPRRVFLPAQPGASRRRTWTSHENGHAPLVAVAATPASVERRDGGRRAAAGPAHRFRLIGFESRSTTRRGGPAPPRRPSSRGVGAEPPPARRSAATAASPYGEASKTMGGIEPSEPNAASWRGHDCRNRPTPVSRTDGREGGRRRVASAAAADPVWRPRRRLRRRRTAAAARPQSASPEDGPPPSPRSAPDSLTRDSLGS